MNPVSGTERGRTTSLDRYRSSGKLTCGRSIAMLRNLSNKLGPVLGALCVWSTLASPAAGAESGALVEAAVKEGTVVVYADTGSKAAAALVKGFQSLYPGIRVELSEMKGVAVFNRFIRDLGAKQATADILWSSATDLQAKLAKDGYAMKYRPAEADAISRWAIADDTAYATTFDPIVFAYNTKLLAEKDVPRNRGALVKALATPKLKGKVVTYDPERSNIGFLVLTQDMANNGDFWSLSEELGKAGAKVYPSTDKLLARLDSGEAVFAFDIPLSELRGREKNIGFVYPTDAAIALTSIILINDKAQHPNAAKLWLNYVLSRRGQQILVDTASSFAVRSDVKGGVTTDTIAREHNASVRPVVANRMLTDFLSQGMRLGFLSRWKQFLGKDK
jgi:iron(III) transport system substrate-binding protein